jgi:hypothetical protein
MLRTELLQMVVERIEEVSRPLLEEVAAIKLLLARVTGSLKRTFDESVEQESFVVGEECIFGSFSPRARSCPSPHRDVPIACESEHADEIRAPVMEIMPELQELCEEPSPMSMLHLQVDPPRTLVVASTPQPVEPSYICDKVMPKL